MCHHCHDTPRRPPGCEATWTVIPEEEWFDSSTSRRPAVGNMLIRSAQELLARKEKVRDNGATTVVEGPWADPLVISYLNIRTPRERTRGLIQRLLSDYFPTQLRQQDARLSLVPAGSLLQTTLVFTGSPHQPIADSERGGKDHCPSSKIVETHEQWSMRCNGTQTPHSPQRSPDVPILTTETSERLHLDRPGLSMPVYTVQFSSFDDRRVIYST